MTIKQFEKINMASIYEYDIWDMTKAELDFVEINLHAPYPELARAQEHLWMYNDAVVKSVFATADGKLKVIAHINEK